LNVNYFKWLITLTLCWWW